MAALKRNRGTWILILLLATGFFLLREKRSLGLPPSVDVTISSATTFAAADASDGVTDGVFTVTGNLTMTSGGTITCNNGDPGSVGANACDIRIVVGGNMLMENGSKISASASGGGHGGNITITVGDFSATPPTGDFTMQTGSQILANSATGSAGAIVINVAHFADVDGLVQSKSGLTGIGAGQPPGGGPITINAGCNLTVSDTGVVSSEGRDPGADLVHLQACVVEIDGLVQSFGPGHAVPTSPINHCDHGNRPDKPTNSTGCVEIWAGDSLTLDSVTHNGQINADIGLNGQVGGRGWIDMFARGPVLILGDTSGSAFDVHSNQGGTNGFAGIIHVASTASTVTASGTAFQVDDLGGGSKGGSVTIEAALDVTLDDASIFARGDFAQSGGFGNGGQITGQSWGGALSWQKLSAVPSIGDVRPTGADTIPPVDVTAPPAAKRGVITLNSCTAAPNVGSGATATSFPFNGDTATTPTLNGPGVCGAGPTLQPYVVLPPADCGPNCLPRITPTPTPTPGTPTVTPTGGTCKEDPNAVLTRSVSNPGSGVPNYDTLQAAYDAAADTGETIGMFGNTVENVNLGGAKTLKITQCTSARITAANSSLPVWNITSTGKLTIQGPDSVGGTIGWLIANLSGGPHTLKSVRANGASVWGIRINSNGNNVSWNDVSGNGPPGGVLVVGSSNILKGGTTGPNTGDGIRITGNSNNLSGATADSNTGNGINVSGNTNTIKGNKASLNSGDGFANPSGTSNNYSGNSSDTGGKDNGGAEYRFGTAGVNGGSNRANGINVPSAGHCPTFPTAGSVCD
jgi:hypothetical protein